MGRSSVANSVRILNLQEPILKMVKAGKLTEGHCKALLGITDLQEQYEAAVRMVEKGETVRQAEKKAHRNKNYPEIDQKYKVIYRDIEDTFQGFFGTRVRVDAGKRRGKIVIEYTSNNDLERILGLLK